MKNLLVVLIGLLVSGIALAQNPNLPSPIKIEAYKDNPIAYTIYNALTDTTSVVTAVLKRDATGKVLANQPTVTRRGKDILLNWATSSDLNNENYIQIIQGGKTLYAGSVLAGKTTNPAPPNSVTVAAYVVAQGPKGDPGVPASTSVTDALSSAISAGLAARWTKTEADNRYKPIDYVPSFAAVTGKPTTRAGYGITDAEGTISPGTAGQFWRGDKTWQTLNLAAVGGGNLNNTSDANKPVSIAQQAALDLKANATDLATANSNSILGWVYSQSFRVVSASRDVNGAITTASIVWPDGSTGTFTTLLASTDFPGAIDSYSVTYVKSGITKTFTQPAITRDSNGAVTVQPSIIIS